MLSLCLKELHTLEHGGCRDGGSSLLLVLLNLDQMLLYLLVVGG